MSTKSGFQVAYEVKESPFGLGLFAREFIAKGTLIWKYSSGVNVRTYKNLDDVNIRLAELSLTEQEFFMSHVYLFDGVMNEILDDGKFWNHSESPNTGSGPGDDPNVDWYSSYAIRDIQVGEELFDDYGCYEYPEYFIELAKKYNVPQDFIVKKDFKKPGFHIPYEIKESTYGLGIFVKEFVPANTLIWRFANTLNIKTYANEEECREYLKQLGNKEAQYEWLSHVYMFDGVVNEILDDGKMWNHSEEPNTYSGYNGDYDSTYSLRDIAAGEELLDDYGQYEYPEWFMQLLNEYNVPIDFVNIKTNK